MLTWYLHAAEAAAAIISPQHKRVPLDPLPPPLELPAFRTLEEAPAVVRGWSGRGWWPPPGWQRNGGCTEFAWKLAAAAMSFFYRRSHWADWVTTHQVGPGWRAAGSATGWRRRGC